MNPHQHIEERAFEQDMETGIGEYAAAMKMEQPLPTSPLLQSVVESTNREREALAYQEGMFAFQQRRAKMFAMSGLFAIKGVTADTAIAIAMVKIELGGSMGFSPAESLQYINVINGVTSIAAAARAARMQLSGYSWDLQWHDDDAGECHGCTIWLRRNGKALMYQRRTPEGLLMWDSEGKPVVEQAHVSFLRKDAERLLTTMWDDNTRTKRRCSVLEKENWKMSPRNMYFARAISNAQRFYAPGCLNPGLLSTEEAMDIDPEEQGRSIASITLDDLRPSVSENRGHGATGLESFRPEVEVQPPAAATKESGKSTWPIDEKPAKPTAPDAQTPAQASSDAKRAAKKSLF